MVEAVVKMLQPGFNVASIAAKRRNKSNPWFERGTPYRSAVDVMRPAKTPMMARANPEAGYRLAGGYPCRASEAEWRDVGWRGWPGVVAADQPNVVTALPATGGAICIFPSATRSLQ